MDDHTPFPEVCHMTQSDPSLFTKAVGPNQSEEEALPHFKIKELTDQLSSCIQHFFGDIRLKGEVGSLKHGRGGHLFMTMKEGEASLDVVVWSRVARTLPYLPKVGDEILVSGGLKTRPGSGVVSLHVQHLIPTGEGLMQAQFEQTCAQFKAQGLFDRVRPLPTLPLGVGLITSNGSSAFHDFYKTASERAPGVPIIFCDAVMQGGDSVTSVSSALRKLYQDQRVEVIALTRGGGAMEHLWYFNHPDLCYLIARSPKPIVVGIGHEDNTLIAELVADVRGHTPTKVAEAILPLTRELSQRVGGLLDRLHFGMDRHGANKFQRLATLEGSLTPLCSQDKRRQRLDELTFELDRSIERVFFHIRSNIDELRARLHRHEPQLRIERARRELFSLTDALKHFDLSIDRREKLMSLSGELERISLNHVVQAEHSLMSIIQSLEDLSPLKTLARGFSFVTTSSGEVIRSTDQVMEGDLIQVQLNEGKLTAEVKNTQVSPSVSTQ